MALLEREGPDPVPLPILRTLIPVERDPCLPWGGETGPRSPALGWLPPTQPRPLPSAQPSPRSRPALEIANTVWNKVLTLTRYPVLILHFYEYSTDFSALKNSFRSEAMSAPVAPTLTAIFETDMALKEPE